MQPITIAIIINMLVMMLVALIVLVWATHRNKIAANEIVQQPPTCWPPWVLTAAWRGSRPCVHGEQRSVAPRDAPSDAAA